MFTRLILRNWRNFSNVDVDLNGRMFLVGPNASGKSNFLDVFRFLSDIAKIGGGFQKAVHDRGGVSTVRSLSARRPSEIMIDVFVTISHVSWRYTVAFTQDNNRNPKLTKEDIWRDSELLHSRPTAEDASDPLRMTQTLLEQITTNKDFREVADFFASIQYRHIVPQLVREPGRSVGRIADPFGGDFLEQLTKVSRNTRESRLKFILSALQTALPQLKSLEFYQDSRNGNPHLRGLFEHWRPAAGWQTEQHFSDGSLRLLGLLWSLLEGQSLLLLEEPELSLHASIVRYIPQILARAQRRRPRQILVSTHSRELLSDPDIRADEVLMLHPGKEGTAVGSGKDDRELAVLLESGAVVADAVIPKTAPQHAEQLAFSLFGEN